VYLQCGTRVCRINLKAAGHALLRRANVENIWLSHFTTVRGHAWWAQLSLGGGRFGGSPMRLRSKSQQWQWDLQVWPQGLMLLGPRRWLRFRQLNGRPCPLTRRNLLHPKVSNRSRVLAAAIRASNKGPSTCLNTCGAVGGHLGLAVVWFGPRVQGSWRSTSAGFRFAMLVRQTSLISEVETCAVHVQLLALSSTTASLTACEARGRECRQAALPYP